MSDESIEGPKAVWRAVAEGRRLRTWIRRERRLASEIVRETFPTREERRAAWSAFVVAGCALAAGLLLTGAWLAHVIKGLFG